MNKSPLWGEQHNGILVNPKENIPLFKKIKNKLNTLIKEKKISDFQLTGRIKDAGMLNGKISRCITKDDFLTIKYEELGFRIVTKNKVDYLKIKKELEQNADFIKDYVNKPRKDGIILGDDPKLCYRAYHIYTKNYFNKPIEIQLMTKKMIKMNNYLMTKYGPYWKQKYFKKKRLDLGDNR